MTLSSEIVNLDDGLFGSWMWPDHDTPPQSPVERTKFDYVVLDRFQYRDPFHFKAHDWKEAEEVYKALNWEAPELFVKVRL